MDNMNYQAGTGEQPTFQLGDEVFGSGGEKVGKVAAVYPNYMVVEKGFFFPHDYYIPASAIATRRAGEIYLNVTKEEALNQRWDEQPADLEGTTTATNANVAAGTARTGDVTAQGEALRVPVHEEELTATKRPVERGQVEVTKDVTAEQQTLDVPVTEERVRVERRVVDHDVPAGEDVFEEGTIAVPVRGEEVNVQKQVRQTGEVDVSKEAVQHTERVADTVRKEQVHVDQSGDLEEEAADSPAQ